MELKELLIKLHSEISQEDFSSLVSYLPHTSMYEEGKSYQTISGDFVEIADKTNKLTNYETVCFFTKGKLVNVYSTRDFGRVTGTSHTEPDPRNLKFPPVELKPLWVDWDVLNKDIKYAYVFQSGLVFASQNEPVWTEPRIEKTPYWYKNPNDKSLVVNISCVLSKDHLYVPTGDNIPPEYLITKRPD